MSEPAEHDQIAMLIAERFGLALGAHGHAELHTAATAIRERHGLGSLDELALHIVSGSPVADELVSELLVGETYFFRHPQQFEQIRAHILPTLRAGSLAHRPMAAWCAGCASGEEAYSLAMVLEDAGLADAFVILGTDLSHAALERARRACYSRWSLRNADEDFIARRFQRIAGTREEFRLREPIRNRVVFEHDNLVIESGPGESGAYDLILCRNVLIYFQPEMVCRVALRLFAALREGGWLITGPSDPVLAPLAPFEVTATEAGLVYRKPGGPSRSSGLDRPNGPSRRASRPTPARTGRMEALRPRVPMPSMGGPVGASQKAYETVYEPAHTLVQETTREAERALARGDYATAVALAQSLPQVPEACAVHVQALVSAGQMDNAHAVLERAIARHPLAPVLHFLLALLLVSHQRYPEAEACARQSVTLEPSLLAGHLLLATIARQTGDWHGAVQAYRHAREAAAAHPPNAIQPLCDGQTTKQLEEAATAQLALLERELAAKHHEMGTL